MSDGFLSPEDRHVCAKEPVCSISMAKRWRRRNLHTFYLFYSPLFIYRRMTRCLILRGGPIVNGGAVKRQLVVVQTGCCCAQKQISVLQTAKSFDTDVNKMMKDNEPCCLQSLKSIFFFVCVKGHSVKGFLFVMSCTSTRNEMVLPLQAVHHSSHSIG